MKDCPQCGKPVDGLVCPFCNGGAAYVDRTQWSCSNEIRGQRCAALGTLSTSTLGGGPWFCHQHFPPFHGMGADAQLTKGESKAVFSDIKAVLKKTLDRSE